LANWTFWTTQALTFCRKYVQYAIIYMYLPKGGYLK
jgi:hypothetical protein